MAPLRNESKIYNELNNLYIQNKEKDISESFFKACVELACKYKEIELYFAIFKLDSLDGTIDIGIKSLNNMLNALHKIYDTFTGKNVKKEFIKTVLYTALKNKQSDFMETQIDTSTECDEDFVNDCYEYLADFSKAIYENEMRREDSLIQQASHMQTAFSFVVAAVFMLVPIVIEHRGIFSFRFIVMVFSSIVTALLFSLFAATMAQNRIKREDFPSVSTIKTKITIEYKKFKTEAQRSKYLLDTYEKMHTSYSETNDKRRFWVHVSMISFYLSLALCVIWFAIMVCQSI